MGAIALLGLIDTAYITYEKLSNQASSICQESCSTVLNSSYAVVLGQPLALFGMGAYGVMLLLAVVPLVVPEEKRAGAIGATRLPLFLGAAAMALFSGYLMYLLATEIHAVCYFCIASAIFSVSLLVLAIVGQVWESVGQVAFPGVIAAMVTLVGTLAVFSPAQAFDPNTTLIQDVQGNVFFAVGTPSGEAESQLAEHLRETGATMYGAYWCPHCCEQKQLFGQSAMKRLNYVECGEGGPNTQVDVCRGLAGEIERETGEKFGFPTWKINGKYYAGRKTLTELAQISGYQGPQNFQNPFQICQMP
jgi:uncharacterized membrane protein